MQTYMQSQANQHTVAEQQTAAESLATAVVRLASQRNQLRDYRQRAEHSSLVNQALQAYRDCLRLQADPAV
ncbi:MAG: hypothetical protein KIS88_02310 [Anaerolineales bacterium]|nr:hypothetical protein [Anaerolineales bacterium]